MKKTLFLSLVSILIIGFISCGAERKAPKTHLYHGLRIADRFVSVLNFTSEEIEFKIRADFIPESFYYIVTNEKGEFIAEGWFNLIQRQRYFKVIKTKAKKGLSFQPGRKYRLCVGLQNPRHPRYVINYRCIVDYWFVLPEKI